MKETIEQRAERFEAILTEAHDAAKAAADAEYQRLKEKGASEPDHLGACGFAWATIRPARGAFINHCRTMGTHGDYSARKRWGEVRDYGGGGWEFWNPGHYNGQSVYLKELAAQAFVGVLVKHGIKATFGSRLD